jgi:uncharacterized delta-60 repeat protein
MARASLLAAVAVLLALAAPAASRQDEARASALRERLTRDWAYALAIQRDGKLVVAGRSVGGGWRFALARYTSRGRLDPSFGQGGSILTAVGSSSYASALAIQRDGKLVAAGRTYGGGLDQDFAIARYTPRGRLDTGFGRGGTVQTSFSVRPKTADEASAVAIQRDGKLVLAGGTGNLATGSDYRFALARFTARGTLDPVFGQSGKILRRLGAWSDARGLAIQSDGKIVAAGYARIGFALARFTGRGKLDRSFGQDGTVLTKLGSVNEANAVAIQADGKIVAAGTADSDFGLVRYTASGKLDRSFGSAGKVTTNFGRSGPGDNPSEDRGLDVAVQHDGKLVVAGSSDALGIEGEKGCCIQDFALARYTPDGDLDPSFGDDGIVLTHFAGISHAQGVVIQADGKIVAAGGGAGSFVLARYTATGKLDPTFGRGGKVVTRLRQQT